jgi:hypothetical protein
VFSLFCSKSWDERERRVQLHRSGLETVPSKSRFFLSERQALIIHATKTWMRPVILIQPHFR